MLVCNSKGVFVVRTEFDDDFYLIQKFRGIDGTSVFFNSPVDFMESGLMYKNKKDYWHIDIPFAINTDEAVPAFVNGELIGANHGCHCAIEVYAPAHGKNFADIGSLWKDEKGEEFTLLQVFNEDYLLFVSEPRSNGTDDYFFVTTVSGQLVGAEDFCKQAVILPTEQKVVDLIPSIKEKTKNIVAVINGRKRTFKGEIECDYVEIREEYYIINPATVAESLRRLRPLKGYAAQPNLADYGEPMLFCSLIYKVTGDGTIFTAFDYKKTANVNFSQFMGAMFQEKLDVFKGGIWRYFPKILPFETAEGRFDFSEPTEILNKPFPHEIFLTRDYFNDNDSPCERCVDYFRDKRGRNKLAFACGFLPLYDGRPEIRTKQVESVLHLKYTRKYYPTFADGNLDRVKGVAYKKYFIPKQNKTSVYSVNFNGEEFIYVDFFANGTLTFPLSGQIELFEKSDSVTYCVKDDRITVRGKKGFAVFVRRDVLD